MQLLAAHEPSTSTSSTLGTWVIAGVVVAAIITTTAAFGIALILRRRRRRHASNGLKAHDDGGDGSVVTGTSLQSPGQATTVTQLPQSSHSAMGAASSIDRLVSSAEAYSSVGHRARWGSAPLDTLLMRGGGELTPSLMVRDANALSAGSFRLTSELHWLSVAKSYSAAHGTFEAVAYRFACKKNSFRESG